MLKKRWSENFTTFLQEHKIEYFVESSQEFCHIDGMPLEEFLKKEDNLTKHEFIRQNILTVTLCFNNRVQEFIKNIVMHKDSPLAVQYYNYRVEFQKGGNISFYFEIYILMLTLIINLV